MKSETKHKIIEAIKGLILAIVFTSMLALSLWDKHTTTVHCQYGVYQSGKRIGKKVYSDDYDCSPKEFYREGFQYKLEKELDR